MISGHVAGLQARIEVVFRLPHRPDLVIEFVVDTGFAGALTLPPAAVTAMGLRHVAQLSANLANDSSVPTEVYQATILWDGAELDVAVYALGKRPLLGTALLDGFNLNADFTDSGQVALQRLPTAGHP